MGGVVGGALGMFGFFFESVDVWFGDVVDDVVDGVMVGDGSAG